jgi:hypothetical protein
MALNNSLLELKIYGLLPTWQIQLCTQGVLGLKMPVIGHKMSGSRGDSWILQLLQLKIKSRDDWIRTSGLVVPNHARYRAAPHPE